MFYKPPKMIWLHLFHNFPKPSHKSRCQVESMGMFILLYAFIRTMKCYKWKWPQK